MSRRKGNGFRFAVGSPDGPRSSIWRVWVNGSDVCIAVRSVAGVLKFSLHSSGDCRLAITDQRYKTLDEIGADSFENRAFITWRHENNSGTKLVPTLLVAVPTVFLSADDSVELNKPVVWLPPGGTDQVRKIAFFFTAHRAEHYGIYGGSPAEFVAHAHLPNGLTLLVGTNVLKFDTSGFFERFPEGRMNVSPQFMTSNRNLEGDGLRALLFGDAPETGAFEIWDIGGLSASRNSG